MPCNDLLYGEHRCLQPASSRCGLLLRLMDLWHPYHATDLHWGHGHGGYCWPSLWGATALGPLTPSTSPSPSTYILGCFLPRSPPCHQSPKPLSIRSLFYHGREPSRPCSIPHAASPPCLSSLGACGHGPTASWLPSGGLACPHPWGRPGEWVPEGGCTSPDPLQPIPSDRTSS